MVDTDWQTFGLAGQVLQWQVDFVDLIVRAHRHTGRKGLFISTCALPAHRGITEADVQAPLPFLQAHASSPNYTVSFTGTRATSSSGTTWPPGTTPSNDYDGPRV
jgi:hypothetical protein